MNKKLLAAIGIVLLMLLIALIVLGTSFRKITVVSGADYVASCPHYARPGHEVTVETVVVTDAEVYVNGADMRYIRPSVYEFTMPDEDVQLKVTVIAFPDGA